MVASVGVVESAGAGSVAGGATSAGAEVVSELVVLGVGVCVAVGSGEGVDAGTDADVSVEGGVGLPSAKAGDIQLSDSAVSTAAAPTIMAGFFRDRILGMPFSSGGGTSEIANTGELNLCQ